MHQQGHKVSQCLNKPWILRLLVPLILGFEQQLTADLPGVNRSLDQ